MEIYYTCDRLASLIPQSDREKEENVDKILFEVLLRLCVNSKEGVASAEARKITRILDALDFACIGSKFFIVSEEDALYLRSLFNSNVNIPYSHARYFTITSDLINNSFKDYDNGKESSPKETSTKSTRKTS